MAGKAHPEKVLYQAIIDANPNPSVISRRSDGTILFANDDYIRTFGHSTEDVIGKKATDYYVDLADRDRILAQLARIIHASA